MVRGVRYMVLEKHYMHNSYGTRGLEERLWMVDGLVKGLSGTALVAAEAKRCHISADPDQHLMMLDYADFNIQHTPRAQAAIFETLATLGVERNATNDWVVCNKWVAAAKYNMRCTFRRRTLEGISYTANLAVVQGMYSGTHSTDLINTLLNIAYFKVAEAHLQGKMLIPTPSSLYHVHQGKDVWISCKDAMWCANLYYVLNDMGLVMQEHKQMFGPHRGEFLRVLYTNGSATGYLGRALANLILKEIQRPIPLDAASMLRSIDTSLATCVRRGLCADALILMHNDLIPHFSKVKSFPGDPGAVTIPSAVVYASRNVGGVGITRLSKYKADYTLASQGDSCPSFPTIPVYDGPDIDNLPSRCTDAWITKIS